MFGGKVFSIVIFVALLQGCACERSVRKYFEKINNETRNFNALAAEVAWNLSLSPRDPDLQMKAADLQEQQLTWQQATCSKLEAIRVATVLNKSQERQIYLLCKGPKFTLDEAREANKLLGKCQKLYSDTEICMPNSKKASKDNLTSIEEVVLNYIAKAKWSWKMQKIFLVNDEEGVPPDSGSMCFRGETELNRIMGLSRNEDVLRWIWKTWREVMAPMKEPFQKLVTVENRAALRNGYADIGEYWRMDMEMPEIKELCDQLFKNVKHLYRLLHGVTRYYLRREYGMMVSDRGPIPAHLLGDLWAQNWEPLADLILPKTIDLTQKMRQAKVKWDLNHMLRRAEDFFTSLGLPAMTDAFWRESVFSRANHSEARCHGAAADMFKNGDFRMIHCTEVTFQDFAILHHEMGHIQYYMAYEKQPAIFRQANSALQETIGDTVMLGAMTPQHLNRLGLIDDSVLFPKIDESEFLTNVSEIIKEFVEDDDYEEDDKTVTTDEMMQGDMATLVENAEPEITADEMLLLRLGLSKLPQIPFALALDEYRWKLFEGSLDNWALNAEFWALIERLQGVSPPGKRGEEYFDVAAKFHVPDNTPYVRYFLGSFLQHQLFESLCKAAVFGRRNVKEPVPSSILLHRCDIYGSKSAGKLLRDIMSRGHSQTWREILEATTGTIEISSAALERYYRPLTELLERLVKKHRIAIGW